MALVLFELAIPLWAEAKRPRPHPAVEPRTYTGMFDAVRKLFASTGAGVESEPGRPARLLREVVEAFSEGRHER